MQWNDQGESNDLEDRRGGGGGGFGGMRLGLGGLVVLGVLSLVFRTNLFALIGQGGDAPAQQTAPVQSSPAETKEVHFVSFVLDDAQKFWDQTLGGRYHHAHLVLYTDVTPTGCGTGEAATGPFYCPADEKVYIDLGFYQELKTRFGAPGEFAQAYVIAHELGHHVQKLLRLTPGGRDRETSIRTELQADCLAGVWGHSAAQRGLLQAGEAEQGLRAASAVGDDRLQRMSGRAVNPETWTHGSSQQRVEWFQRGMQRGDPAACDTFAQ